MELCQKCGAQFCKSEESFRVCTSSTFSGGVDAAFWTPRLEWQGWSGRALERQIPQGTMVTPYL